MERSYLLLTGALSGLVSALAHAVIWSLAEAVRPRLAATNAASQQFDVPDMILHMLAGTGLGLLFWLSWGLTAIVDVPWWLRGLTFGSLGWLTLGLPAVISTARAAEIARAGAAAIAARWAMTCVITGLACAWSWQARF